MIGKNITFYFVGLIFLGINPSYAQSEERGQKLRQFYVEQLRTHGIVGSSILISQEGKVIEQFVYGAADKDASVVVDEQTIFHWASITKTLTGIAIMQLRDRELLRLDDPVSKYIPEIREVHNEFGSMDSITIRHLLTHTAGFRSGTWPWANKAWQPDSPQHWSQLVAMFPYTEILFKPGTRWNYSNPGIVLLGRIIELISKDDFEYYVDKNILKPLQMYHSYFDSAPVHLLEDVSHSYWVDSALSLRPALFNLNTGITVSNGGLSSTMSDMSLYLNFLLGNGDKKRNEQILARRSLEEMWNPYHKIVEEHPYGSDQEWQGLIFFLEDIYNMRIIGHSGYQNGFQTHMYFDPGHNIGYLVAYNTAGRGARGLDDAIKEFVLREYFLPAQKK